MGVKLKFRHIKIVMKQLLVKWAPGRPQCVNRIFYHVTRRQTLLLPHWPSLPLVNVSSISRNHSWTWALASWWRNRPWRYHDRVSRFWTRFLTRSGCASYSLTLAPVASYFLCVALVLMNGKLNTILMVRRSRITSRYRTAFGFQWDASCSKDMTKGQGVF